MNPRRPRESAAALDAAVDAAQGLLVRLHESSSLEPMRPGGWCARETLGHLADSACNNLRRFVVGQTPGLARFDGYAQDEWVARQAYRHRSWQDLTAYWTALQRQVAHVMRHTDDGAAEAAALAPDGEGPVSVRFLMHDYVEHLQHHLAQIRSFAESLPRSWPTGDVVATPEPAWPERLPLSGLRHDFVPVDPDRHAPDLFAAGHGPGAAGLWTYMWYGPFDDVGAMHRWLASCAASPDIVFFTVLDKASGRAVGMCSLLRIDRPMRSIEVGHIWYDPAVQGRGVNADMALALLGACFERWGYRRAEWKCDALNTRSRAAALGLGFTFEGLFRQHMVIKGRSRDTAWFSLLDHEWPAVKARLTTRLES